MLGSAGRAQRLWQGKHRVMSQLSLVHPTPGTCDTLLPPPCWPHSFSMGIWRAPGLGFLGGPGHLLVLASSWVVRQPRRATASPGPRRSSPIWWPHPAGSPLRSPLSGQPGPCPQGTVGRAGRAQHHQHVPHSPSTHLSWAEDGLGEELDEVGGRTVSSSSLTASLRVPSRPLQRQRGLTWVPCPPWGPPHAALVTPPCPLCLHSPMVLGGAGEGQELEAAPGGAWAEGVQEELDLGGRVWMGGHMPVPCAAPPLGDSPGHPGSARGTTPLTPVGPSLWSLRPHTGGAEVPPGPCPIAVCPELLTCPRKSFLPTMFQSQTSTSAQPLPAPLLAARPQAPHPSVGTGLS